jgi:hypothetical protein
MKPLQSTWWVSVDERNLFEWVKDAPSSERAWIYQERHLYVLFLPTRRSSAAVKYPPAQSFLYTLCLLRN